MKRKIAMLLALALLFSASGCKSSEKDDNGKTESYIVTYEDVYEDVPGEKGTTEKTTSGKTKTIKKGGGTTTVTDDSNQSSGKKDTSAGKYNNTGAGAGATSTKALKEKGTIANIDFGGKSFTKTIVGVAPAYKIRLKEAFEKKFNCKVKFVNLPWETYNSKVASAMAAGQPYDICGLHFYFWPEAGIQGLYEPLDSYFYKADLYDENSKSTAGIDLEQSRYYSWNGSTFGVANNRETYCGQPDVYYYNKALIKGFEDPMKLYLEGKWTWDKLFEIAEIVTKGGRVKMFGTDFAVSSLAQRDGIVSTKIVNGKVKTNLDDPAWPSALKKCKEFYDKYCGNTDSRSEYTDFMAGKYFMHQQTITWGTFDGYDMIIKSPAFKKNFKNLGIVPLPKGPNNKTDFYQLDAPQAKAAGKGSKDPRAAVAWVWFASEWQDPMKKDDPSLYPAEVYKMLDKVYRSHYYTHPNYKTSSKKVMDLESEIFNNYAAGNGDFTKLVADRIATIQSIIDDSLKQ